MSISFTARERRAELSADQYLALLRRARQPGPRFQASGLPRTLRLELQFALQCRHDAGRAKLTPRVFGAVATWARELAVKSLLDESDRFWRERTRLLRAPLRAQALAFLRYARKHLQELREEASGTPVWDWDTWRVDQLDRTGRWPTSRSAASTSPTSSRPGCARSPSAGRAGGSRRRRCRPPPSSARTARCGACLAGSSCANAMPETPAELTRELLERFMADLRASATGEVRKRSILVDLKIFLDDLRRHGWQAELPTSSVYHRGELPRALRPVPRYIDEFVMGQIEAQENLARLPDQATRTLVILLIETGCGRSTRSGCRSTR